MTHKDLVIETVDATRRTYSIRGIAIIFLVLGIAFLPWLLMHDLFTTPETVLASRTRFNELKNRYEDQSEKWIHQKNEVLATLEREQSISDLIGSDPILLKDIPLEVLIAFLFDDLGLSGDTFSTFAMTSIEKDGTLLLSKEEQSWPQPIVTSLAIALDATHSGWKARFTSLQRGSRKIDPNLAWTYFSTELSQLRAVAFLATGTEHFDATEETWSLLWRPSQFQLRL